jgi:putative ABC transport system permease protein
MNRATRPPLGLMIRLALRSLFLHKLRSALAMLGIVIGTGAVIALLTLGAGSRQEALEQIKRLGATNIIVRSVKPPEEGAGTGQRFRILKYGLTRDDFDRIAQTIPTIWRALPLRAFRYEIRYLDRAYDGRVVGTTPLYAEILRINVAEGRFLSPRDEEAYDNVAVLGAEVAQELFRFEDPIGKAIKMNNHYYRVVGVVSRRMPTAGPGGSLAPEDYNKDVYIPLSTCRARFGDMIVDRRSGQFSAEEVALSQITISVRDSSEVRATGSIVTDLIKRYHTKPDYALTIPLDLLEEAERTALLWAVFLGVVAGIALIVGGIGIANIMLASVMERTREIGIRRAIGAKRRDIALQFLIEAIAITALGGMLGLFVGYAAPELIRLLAGWVFDYVVATKIMFWSFPLAFLISVVVGICSGLYPAQRAARMDPIEALRHE